MEELDEEDVRKYSLELMEAGVKASTFNIHQAGIRFFFAVMLNRSMNYLQMPRLKEKRALPEILSREEIGRLLEECGNLKHKAMFAPAYGSGLRVSEICRLRVTHSAFFAIVNARRGASPAAGSSHPHFPQS